MWEFIVMGQIPGTQIQINFDTWLFFIAVPMLFLAIGKLVSTAYHSNIVLGMRVRHILQTAAYARAFATRRHIQI